MKVSMRGGTPDLSKNLCESCNYSHIIEFVNGEYEVYCCADHLDKRIIKTKVVRCSSWSDAKALKLYDLEKIAWIINPKKGGRAGFDVKPYSKLTNEEQHDIEVDAPWDGGN